MPLSADSAHVYGLIIASNAMDNEQCNATADRVIAAVAAPVGDAAVHQIPDFAQDGVYRITLNAGLFGHHIVVVCVGGEKTIYQAWVGNFTLRAWLGGATDPQHVPLCPEFHQSRGNYAPNGNNFVLNPAARFNAWRAEMIVMQGAWLAGTADNVVAGLGRACGWNPAFAFRVRMSVNQPLVIVCQRHAFTPATAAGFAAAAVVAVPPAMVVAPAPPPPAPPPADGPGKCCVIL